MGDISCELCRTKSAGSTSFFAPSDVIGELQFWTGMLRSRMHFPHSIDPTGKRWLQPGLLEIIERQECWAVCKGCSRSFTCKAHPGAGGSARTPGGQEDQLAARTEYRNRYLQGRQVLLAAWGEVHGGAPQGLAETVDFASPGKRTVRNVDGSGTTACSNPAARKESAVVVG